MIRSVQYARSRATRGLLAMLAVVMVAALAVPGTAVASPLSALDVTLLLQPQGSMQPLLLIAGRLPEGTTLPAEIVLPAPPDAEVIWAGEILGGPVENDPAAEPLFETRDGVNVAVFTLTQSLVGQIEIEYPAGAAALEDGLFRGGFELAAPADVESVRLAVAVPPTFQAAALPDGVLTSEVEGGVVYYYVERGVVSAGDALEFGLDYRGAPPGSSTMVPASQPAAGGGEVPLFLIVLIAAVLAGAVLLVLFSRSKRDETISSEPETFAEPEADVSAEETFDFPAPAIPAGDTTHAEPQVAASGSGAAGLLTPKILLIGAAVLVIGVIIALNVGGTGGQVGVTDISGNLISQRISTAAADSQAEFSLIIACDCPPEAEAVKMFDALRQVPGVAHATLDASTLVMLVEYDPALAEESAIADRLRAAGYLK